MNVFSKTVPWLVSASAILTLSFSANVSAKTSQDSQATKIKNVQNKSLDQINYRMLYLNSSIRFFSGNFNLPLPKDDGLTSNHDNVNAYRIKGYDGNGQALNDITYTTGKSPKVYNDPTLQLSSGNAAFDQDIIAGFSWGPKKDLPPSTSNYMDPDQLKKALSSSSDGTVGSADLGNGIQAVTFGQYIDSRYDWMDPTFQYDCYFWQGDYEIHLTFKEVSNENDALAKAKQIAPQFKGKHFADTDGHGMISLKDTNMSPNMEWQKGNTSYSMGASHNNLADNLKVLNSVS